MRLPAKNFGGLGGGQPFRRPEQSREFTKDVKCLARAGVANPTGDQLRVARLVEQVTFGVLTCAVGGELDASQAVADIRLACRSLIGHGFGAPTE
jgi:hypothetical protein